jgi:hypothetical protein
MGGYWEAAAVSGDVWRPGPGCVVGLAAGESCERVERGVEDSMPLGALMSRVLLPAGAGASSAAAAILYK